MGSSLDRGQRGQRRSPPAPTSSQLWFWLASISQMAEAQSSRSLDWLPPSHSDHDKHHLQMIPGTRLRSNPPPVRFLDRLAEPRTALPARFVTQPLARQIADRAVQTEFLGVQFLGPEPKLSLPRSPFETARSIARHSP